MNEQIPDEYCGFVCSAVLERVQSILNDIDDFGKYNKEFAQVMRFKVTQMCLDSRNKSSIAISQ
jgi:hypothetical protein